MKEWLKEIKLEPDFSKRITKNVMKRAKKRKIRERIAISTLSFFFVFALIVWTNFPLSRGSRNIYVANIQETGSRNLQVANGLNNEPQVKTTEKERRLKPAATNTAEMEREKTTQAEACGYQTLRLPKPAATTTQSVTPKFQKFDDSFEITWDGDGEFIVYKCESPKFDTCSFSEVVKGNKYLDKNEGSGKIVYYRIEPLKKG